MSIVLKPRKPLPDVGELVVGTVEEIYDYGAYLTLDEYGGVKAFLPWSEVASRMVRSISEVVKPRQKVVVKVIRVYKNRGQVDVSLKRVFDDERRKKMAQYKRTVKAVTIIELTAKKLGKSIDEAYREVVWRLEDKYGDVMSGLEDAVLRGPKALIEAGVPSEWVEPLLEVARSHIKIKQVKVSGVFTLKSFKPDGVIRIKKALIAARDAASGEGVAKVRIYTIGAPRYRIDIYGHDYRALEEALNRALSEARRVAEAEGLEFSFERLKE